MTATSINNIRSNQKPTISNQSAIKQHPMFNPADVDLNQLVLFFVQKAKQEMIEEQEQNQNNPSSLPSPAQNYHQTGQTFQQSPGPSHCQTGQEYQQHFGQSHQQNFGQSPGPGFQQFSPQMPYQQSPTFLSPTSPAYQNIPAYQNYMIPPETSNMHQQPQHQNQQQAPSGFWPTVPGSKSQNGTRVVHVDRKGLFPAAVKTENIDAEPGRFFKGVTIQGETPLTQETSERMRGNLPNIKMERVEMPAQETQMPIPEQVPKKPAERKPDTFSAPPSLPSPGPIEHPLETEQEEQLTAGTPIVDQFGNPVIVNGVKLFAAAPSLKNPRASIFQSTPAPSPPPTIEDDDDDCVIIQETFNYNQPKKVFTPQFASVKREIFPVESTPEPVKKVVEERPAQIQMRQSTRSDDVAFGTSETSNSEIQVHFEQLPVRTSVDLARELNMATNATAQRSRTATPAPRSPVEPSAPSNWMEQLIADSQTPVQHHFNYPVTSGFSNSSKVTNTVPQKKDESRKRPQQPPVPGPKKIRAKEALPVPKKDERVQNKPAVRPMDQHASYNSRMDSNNSTAKPQLGSSVPKKDQTKQNKPAVRLMDTPAPYNSRVETNNSNARPQPGSSTPNRNGNSNFAPKEVPRKILQTSRLEQRVPAPSRTPAPVHSSDLMGNIMSNMNTPITVQAPGAKRAEEEKRRMADMENQRKCEMKRQANTSRQLPRPVEKRPKMVSVAESARHPTEIYRANNGSRLYGPKSPGPQRSPSYGSPY